MVLQWLRLLKLWKLEEHQVTLWADDAFLSFQCTGNLTNCILEQFQTLSIECSWKVVDLVHQEIQADTLQTITKAACRPTVLIVETNCWWQQNLSLSCTEGTGKASCVCRCEELKLLEHREQRNGGREESLVVLQQSYITDLSLLSLCFDP